MTDSAERNWQRWGNENPFFGVLSDPKFLKANLNDESREEFFRSGEQHVQDILQVVQTRVRQEFHPNRVIDFGCGVGRLLIPFAKRAQKVVGIDVSPGMLAEAKTNCSERGVDNVSLLNVHEIETLEGSSFDLVHSVIVFQHIPVSKGEALMRRLMSLIADGGVGVLHVTFSDTRASLKRAVSALRLRSGLVHGVLNIAQGKPYSWPLMEMNCYSINRIFNLLIEAHCSNLHVEFIDHAGFRGAILYFEKLVG